MKIVESYNPFKMWGSYVISLLFYLAYVVVYKIQSGDGTLLTYSEAIQRTLGLGFDVPFNLLNFIITLIVMVTGFLIGWGIHSLIRKLT